MLPVSDFNYIEKKEKIDLIGKVKLKILVFFAVILTLLFGAQIIFAGNLTSDGKKLHEVSAEANRLESENLYLKSKIAKVSSLTNLFQRSQEMGFHIPSKVLNP